MTADRIWRSCLICLRIRLLQLQNILVSALSDKNLSLQGDTTVMQFIGG
jgi:hypothetical protein